MADKRGWWCTNTRHPLIKESEMATYYMSIKDSTRYWEPCKSATLAGAKREATRALSGRCAGNELLAISTGDNITEQRFIVATRRVNADRWDAAA